MKKVTQKKIIVTLFYDESFVLQKLIYLVTEELIGLPDLSNSRIDSKLAILKLIIVTWYVTFSIFL